MDVADRTQQDADLVSHERAYKGFNVLLRWCMALLGSGLLMLTLWFATGTGFFGSLVVGLVAFALSYYFLVRHELRQPLDVWRPGR